MSCAAPLFIWVYSRLQNGGMPMPRRGIKTAVFTVSPCTRKTRLPPRDFHAAVSKAKVKPENSNNSHKIAYNRKYKETKAKKSQFRPL